MPSITLDLLNAYTGPFCILLPKVTLPLCQTNIERTIEARFFNIFIADISLEMYKLQVNLGSVPPFPSGTSSSQYFAN